ncbi:hypothetical protein GF407_13925 [candidate division KSB1 bacterium]|nr:hypothetical protein [candidate division KSB1 bacterium]
MKRTITVIRRGFVSMIMLAGVMINSVYTVSMLSRYVMKKETDEFREILVSGISLEFAWAALLLWALFRPFERRYVLLFTAFAMLTANVLHSLDQLFFAGAGIGRAVLNLSVGMAVSGLFVIAFFVSRPNTMERSSS